MLRSEFWRLVERNSTLAGADLDSHDEDSTYLWHLAHCFGYLRQTIVCNMDMTLEYPTLKGANEGTVNGYEIPHQCVRRVSVSCQIAIAALTRENRNRGMSLWMSTSRIHGR